MLHWNPFENTSKREVKPEKDTKNTLASLRSEQRVAQNAGQIEKFAQSGQAQARPGLASLIQEDLFQNGSPAGGPSVNGQRPSLYSGLFPQRRDLATLSEVVSRQPVSILKRQSPLACLPRKQVRFHEPVESVAVEGQVLQVSRKAFSDLRMSQQRLNRHFTVLESSSLVLGGTPMPQYIEPVIHLYKKQIKPNQAHFNQVVRDLMHHEESVHTPTITFESLADYWDWQKVLVHLMESSLKALHTVPEVQVNEYLNGDVQELLEEMKAHKQALESVFVQPTGERLADP